MPEDLKYLNFPRLFACQQLWASVRTVAKYGYDQIEVPSEKLFGKEEAELAIKHAKDCKQAVDMVAK